MRLKTDILTIFSMKYIKYSINVQLGKIDEILSYPLQTIEIQLIAALKTPLGKIGNNFSIRGKYKNIFMCMCIYKMKNTYVFNRLLSYPSYPIFVKPNIYNTLRWVRSIENILPSSYPILPKSCLTIQIEK